MVAVVEFVAVLSCTLFTGAAIYITLVEHPARMGGETKIAASCHLGLSRGRRGLVTTEGPFLAVTINSPALYRLSYRGECVRQLLILQ